MRFQSIIIVILSALFSPIGSAEDAPQASRYNCVWAAEKTDNNFNAEDRLATLDSCSLFIRSIIIGSDWWGPLANLMVGKESVGTLTFTAKDGTKRVCQTLVKNANPPTLSRAESIVTYLKSELDGEALNPSSRAKAEAIIRGTGVDVPALIKKIDDSVELKCSEPTS